MAKINTANAKRLTVGNLKSKKTSGLYALVPMTEAGTLQVKTTISLKGELITLEGKSKNQRFYKVVDSVEFKNKGYYISTLTQITREGEPHANTIPKKTP